MTMTMSEVPKIVIPLSPLDQHLFQRRCQRLKAVSLPIASPSVGVGVGVSVSSSISADSGQTSMSVGMSAAPGAKAEAEGGSITG